MTKPDRKNKRRSQPWGRSKITQNFAHSNRRLKIRYGLYYSEIMRQSILNQINNGECVLIKDDDNNQLTYKVLYIVQERDIQDRFSHKKQDKIELLFVYSKINDDIITFLTEEDQYNKQSKYI